MVKLASEVLSRRKNLKATFASARRKNVLNDLLRVGTSAGGRPGQGRYCLESGDQ